MSRETHLLNFKREEIRQLTNTNYTSTQTPSTIMSHPQKEDNAPYMHRGLP